MPFFCFNNTQIVGVSTALPTNKVFANSMGKNIDPILVNQTISQTGIQSMHLAKENQTASDLGFVAAEALLVKKRVLADDVCILLFLSKTPDYRSPATAMVLHHRLGLKKECLAYDINMGNNGFVYGLQVGCSLLESMAGKYALLVVGDTTSKQISDDDPHKLGFGDGSGAILLEKNSNSSPICLKTTSDGEQFGAYILSHGGFRKSARKQQKNETSKDHLYAVGGLQIDHDALNKYAESELVNLVKGFIDDNNVSLNEVSLFAVPQESDQLVNRLIDLLRLPDKKVPFVAKSFGNLCGASVPLLLSERYGLNDDGGLVKVLACSHGEGLSSGVVSFYINPADILPTAYTDHFFTDGLLDQ